MLRRAWVVGWVTVGLTWVAVIALYLAAIWSGIGRLAGMATILLLADLAGTLVMSWWSAEAPQPNPTRSVRKQLRVEQNRIALEKAIANAEREAGLR